VLGWVAGFVLGAAVGAAAVWLILGRGARGTPPGPSQTAGRAEIVSKVAHELKNPIMSVKGLAATGSRLYESMSDEERLEFFQLIDSEAERLRIIAEQASTAMKIDAGRVEYVKRLEDLGKLVEEIAWHAPVGDHPMVVETESDLSIPIDRARIAEVIANLIDNAAKFSPAGTPIEVRASRAGDGSAVIEVRDRGPGIPEEQREAVMARFSMYRPPGYEEVPGAGLGLFICRAHVLAHGGRLSIEGQPGSGTMLRVTLPGR